MAFWTFVNNSLLGGVAGAALTVGLMELVSWLRRPRLHLEFIPGEEGYLTESTHDENGVRVTRKYLRVRLTVKGTTGKNCRIYLASVRPVVEQKVQADWLIDSRQLSWPPYNDFAARDIPQGLNMFVNLTTRNAAEEEWRFEIEHSFGLSAKILEYQGDLQLRITATADNAKPLSIEIRAALYERGFDAKKIH